MSVAVKVLTVFRRLGRSSRRTKRRSKSVRRSNRERMSKLLSKPRKLKLVNIYSVTSVEFLLASRLKLCVKKKWSS